MKHLGRSEKGQVIVLMATSMVGLLAMTGLALDVGIMYGVKTKLDAALDGASLAAGKAISRGTGTANRQAQNFFDANFPSGALGATVTEPSVTATQNADKSWTVTASATATIPTYFVKLFGVNSFSVPGKSTTLVRTLDMILVVDSSYTLNYPANTPDLVKNAAQDFIDNFVPSSARIGLIHFGSGAVVDVPITSNLNFSPGTLKQKINNITFAGGRTTEEALRLAQEQLDAIPALSQSSVRAIVLLSGGAPNGISVNHAGVPMALYSEIDSSLPWAQANNGAPFRLYDLGQQFLDPGDPDPADPPPSAPGTWDKAIPVLQDTDYLGTVYLKSYANLRPLTGGTTSNSWCNVNMAARNMAENVANAARSESGNPIYIFTIGFGNGVTTAGQEMTTCYGSNNYTESGENILRRLANVSGVDTYNRRQPSGLYVYAQSAMQLKAGFDKIASAILRFSN